MFEVGFAKGTLEAVAESVPVVMAAGEVPAGRSFAFYGVAEKDAEKGQEVPDAANGVLATMYARPTETGDLVLAHLARVRKGPTYQVVSPRDLVIVSEVRTDTKARFCGHAACVARLGGKHLPDRIDKVGATYCKGREGDGDKSRKVRNEATTDETRRAQHRWVTQREFAAIVVEQEQAEEQEQVSA